MLTNTPKLYSHAELQQPAKPIDQKPVQLAPANPYQFAPIACLLWLAVIAGACSLYAAWRDN